MGAEAEEQAFIVSLRLSDGCFGCREDRESIASIVERFQDEFGELGQYDGHELGGGMCHFYFYGESAERLAGAALSIIDSFPVRPGSYAVKRYGGPGAHEERIVLGNH